MGYNSIAWLPLAAGLTILGLLLSYLAYRRRGLRPALMGTAFSLLPIAAYLTGALEMLWKIGAAIGQFGTGFVFSTSKWVGIGVTGLAIALFFAAGGRVRRRAAREARRAARAERADRKGEADGAFAPPELGRARNQETATRAVSRSSDRRPVPVDRATAATSAKASRKATPPVDDDMKDIEDILRKRGL
jgi:hypothetical protein